MKEEEYKAEIAQLRHQLAEKDKKISELEKEISELKDRVHNLFHLFCLNFPNKLSTHGNLLYLY